MGRKQKTIHYLYKTTCKVTEKYYIGIHSTSDLEDGYLGSGKRLRYSIRKYGKENHVKEILEYFDTREELKNAEKKIITEDVLNDRNCMNLMSGGTGGLYSIEHIMNIRGMGGNVHKERLKNDKTYREKYLIRVKLIRENYLNSGKHSGKNNPRPMLGKFHSEETKQKMRKSKNLGEQNSQFGTIWITNGNENKKIKKADIDSWLKDGWIKGRSSFNHK